MAHNKKITNIKWRQIIVSYIAVYILFAALTILPNLDKFSWVNFAVQLASLAILLFALALYIYFADVAVMESPRKTWAMFTTMIVAYALIQLSSYIPSWGYVINLVPFALCALILSLIVSSKCGFFANFIIIMLCFMQDFNWQTNSTSETFFYLLFSGVIEAVFVSYVLGKHYRRFRYLLVGVALGIVSVMCATISYLMFQDIENWNWVDYGLKAVCSFGSGIIGVMLMFVFVPLFERIFNVSSVFRFSEIATSDSNLMRKLFEKAPGTYNHCLTVATYAEACAAAIGQSAVMARAAAYYHDIGKIKNPSYFVENQFNGVNPHDSMTPEASVNMIKYHTLNGLQIAKEYGLPKEVQMAIVEHHGTMPLKYFYLKAQKYTDGELSYDGYCYDGPKPSNKISAILMICDAAEAALRANGDKSNAEKIVNEIVAERLAFEQFSDCDISLKELDIIKGTIVNTFSGIRHNRISYPDVRLQGDK